MKHSLIGMGLLLITATSAQASIVCQSNADAEKPVQVVIDLGLHVPVSPRPQYVAGVTKITSEGQTHTFHSTFTVSQQYLRIGYEVAMHSKLSEDLTLGIAARSYTNVGPATKQVGRLLSMHDQAVTQLICK